MKTYQVELPSGGRRFHDAESHHVEQGRLTLHANGATVTSYPTGTWTMFREVPA